MRQADCRRLLDDALARRESLRTPETNAFRLLDGEGDDIFDVYLEEFAGSWLVSTKSAPPTVEMLEWLKMSGRSVYWKKLDQHQKDSPSHLCGPEAPEFFEILENGARFKVSFQSGYSQGIFLDQRDNRQRVRERCQPGDTVLNTFAYTGAFSVAAAQGGAITTTLDLSQPYLDWARDNFALNGLDPEDQFFIKGDTFHWLRRFAKQERRFTGIILDPPSFSRDKKGQVFKADKDYGLLVELAAAVVEPGGWILCTTNHRGIKPWQLEITVREAAPQLNDLEDFPMPPDFNGEQYMKTLLLSDR